MRPGGLKFIYDETAELFLDRHLDSSQGNCAVNQSEMLHQMCRDALSDVDVRAICKNRGLPSQAASSRALLESLFLSDTGVVAAFGMLDRMEIALVYLLRAVGEPVDVAFFSRLNPPEEPRWHHHTFNQRFQGVFSTVKERLVRRGILIMAQAPQTYPEKTIMERWRFALPAQFADRLPPLIESAKRLDGEGIWRSDVARDKLRAAVAPGTAVHGDGPNFRDEEDVVRKKELHRHENGTVAAGRKGTGTFFGLGAGRSATIKPAEKRASPRRPARPGATSSKLPIASFFWGASRSVRPGFSSGRNSVGRRKRPPRNATVPPSRTRFRPRKRRYTFSPG